MWFSRPKPEKTGQKNLKIKDGAYDMAYAFRGAIKPRVFGGVFSGKAPLYGAKAAQVSGGEFRGSLSFFSAENAMVSGGIFTGKMACYGAQGTRVMGGDFQGDWAFMEAHDTLVAQGCFSGLAAFSEARQVIVEDGDFTGDEMGITGADIHISGGRFTGKELLKTSSFALVTGEIQSEMAFAGATRLRVLHPGTIRHVCAPISGIIAARHIRQVSFPEGKPEDLQIFAETVDQGMEFVTCLPQGTLPEKRLPETKALEFLKKLANG